MLNRHPNMRGNDQHFLSINRLFEYIIVICSMIIRLNLMLLRTNLNFSCGSCCYVNFFDGVSDARYGLCRF